MNEKSIHSLLNVRWDGRVLLDRIESSVSSGVADCNAVFEGCEFWMEYKVIGHKARTTVIPIETPLGTIWLRPAQYSWHVKRARAGGRAFVIGRTENAIVAYRCQSDGTWKHIFTTCKPFDYNSLLANLVSE
jgi:hypothetical protein